MSQSETPTDGERGVQKRQGFLKFDGESWYATCMCEGKMRPVEGLDGGARLACEAEDCERTMAAFSEVFAE